MTADVVPTEDWHSYPYRGETWGATTQPYAPLRTHLCRNQRRMCVGPGRGRRGQGRPGRPWARARVGSEPDGFAVLGGQDMTVEYVDPGMSALLPGVAGSVSRSSDEAGSQVFQVALRSRDGVSALMKGLAAADGVRTTDLLLKRIESEGGPAYSFSPTSWPRHPDRASLSRPPSPRTSSSSGSVRPLRPAGRLRMPSASRPPQRRRRGWGESLNPDRRRAWRRRRKRRPRRLR